MDGKLPKPGLKYSTIVIILVIVSMGCLCLPANLFPTSLSPTPPVSSTLTVAPVMPTDTVPPVPPTDTDQPGVETPVSSPANLDETGPWLLMETNQGLWAANSDGSGLIQLTDVDYTDVHFYDSNLVMAVQPGGNQFVFLSPATTYDLHNMTLNLLSLPDGTITKITDLTSPETEAYMEVEMSEPAGAIRRSHSYTWSPDGTRLAFVGLMDGPSAEVYLYDVASGGITRVSFDDDQDYWVSWSPDGNTLLYFGAKTFGTGGGFDTTSVWYAQGDGTDASLLYVPEDDNVEVVGWLDNKTVVLDTWSMHCEGDSKLRLYDLTSREVTMLNEDCFTSAAADSGRGAAIFADSTGLYLLTNENRVPTQVSQEQVARIDNVEPGEFFFTVYYSNGMLSTYGTSEMDYQVSPIVASGSLDVAMYGWIWGWTSEDNSEAGAWITGPGVEIGKIFDYNARLPTWDEHNNLLFFAPYADTNGYNLYRTTFDAYYRDLEMVGFVDAEVIEVAWLGGQ